MSASSSSASTALPSWSPQSWRSKPVGQPVDYGQDSAARLAGVTQRLAHLPPLVTNEEIDRLRGQLAQVAENKAFLLQGGDCAELFDYCNNQAIEQRLSLLLLSSLVVVFGARTPVVRILRGAGQYAKPRSKSTETIDGKEILTFRGENVNGIELSDRQPDPERLLQAYFHSAATINYIRGLLSSGFADLHNPRSWSLSHVRDPALAKAFEKIVERLEDSLDFLRVVGGENGTSLRTVDLWTSHEGLMLEYEEALTRPGKAKASTTFYNGSAHFLWIGDRTRDINGAHIEYFRGIQNPIGLKAGPSLEPAELVRLLDILDPENKPGKVTIICRYGASKVDDCLPGHIKAVQATKHKVIFCADIMHGNTTNAGKYKTRHLADLVSELSRSFEIHTANQSRLQGVHLEMTGDTNADGFSVTECLGGSMELDVAELAKRYESFCDPRLNTEQTLDIAFLVADFLSSMRKGQATGHHILDSLSSRATSRDREARKS